MGSRRVNGLLGAKRLSERPKFIPVGRPRGVKALGCRYERALATMLGPMGFAAGIWWEYQDAVGPGVCQTDLVLVGQSYALVLEAKHSWTLEGHRQLEYLYLPVVGMATGKPAVGIQVCKFARDMPPGVPVVSDLKKAVGLAQAGMAPVLHWSGVTDLVGNLARAA